MGPARALKLRHPSGSNTAGQQTPPMLTRDQADAQNARMQQPQQPSNGINVENINNFNSDGQGVVADLQRHQYYSQSAADRDDTRSGAGAKR